MSHHSMLWPRQEVLQLIIPQLLTTRKNVFAVIKQLSKHQTTEGKIRYILFFLLINYISNNL